MRASSLVFFFCLIFQQSSNIDAVEPSITNFLTDPCDGLVSSQTYINFLVNKLKFIADSHNFKISHLYNFTHLGVHNFIKPAKDQLLGESYDCFSMLNNIMKALSRSYETINYKKKDLSETVVKFEHFQIFLNELLKAIPTNENVSIEIVTKIKQQTAKTLQNLAELIRLPDKVNSHQQLKNQLATAFKAVFDEYPYNDRFTWIKGYRFSDESRFINQFEEARLSIQTICRANEMFIDPPPPPQVISSTWNFLTDPCDGLLVSQMYTDFLGAKLKFAIGNRNFPISHLSYFKQLGVHNNINPAKVQLLADSYKCYDKLNENIKYFPTKSMNAMVRDLSKTAVMFENLHLLLTELLEALPGNENISIRMVTGMKQQIEKTQQNLAELIQLPDEVKNKKQLETIKNQLGTAFKAVIDKHPYNNRNSWSDSERFGNEKNLLKDFREARRWHTNNLPDKRNVY